MLNYPRTHNIHALNLRGTMTFSALMQMFPNISEMTLRKDLKSLDEEGKLVRIHGGARSLDTVLNADAPLTQRLSQNMELKREIALKARALVQPGMTVFMDSGSTMTELAKAFQDVPCTVFTGGLTCVQELSRLTQADVFVLGGRVNKSSMSVRDARLASDLKELYFDVAFISVNGFSKENGFSCRSADRWYMERTAVSRASLVVVLMDSTKVGRVCSFSICGPDGIDKLVSDSGLDAETREALESAGVEVL